MKKNLMGGGLEHPLRYRVIKIFWLFFNQKNIYNFIMVKATEALVELLDRQ